MTTGLLLFAILTTAPADEAAPPAAIQKYLADCEAARTAAIRKLYDAISVSNANPGKRRAMGAELDRMRKAPADMLPLPLPPGKEGIGIFAPPEPGDGRGGRSVDVLEVVDEDDAILRVWYAPAPSSTDQDAPSEDPTFVDLWVHGIDTAGLKANQPVRLMQVFQVTGTKMFDTTCGGRSMTLLEPVDVEQYRPAKKK
jgi:hypothetical protein